MVVKLGKFEKNVLICFSLEHFLYKLNNEYGKYLNTMKMFIPIDPEHCSRRLTDGFINNLFTVDKPVKSKHNKLTLGSGGSDFHHH